MTDVPDVKSGPHEPRSALVDHESPPLVSMGRRRPGYPALKTGLEWIGALLLLASATPFLVGLAVLVKATSSGPAFYSQVRLGRHGRIFRIHKLRTMTHGAEATTGPVWSIGNDPRVTPLGRWLRDTHLDELPQLWNVVRGDMSLIGPRPERPEIAAKIERAIPEFRYRLLVRPGITGLAQMRLPADSDLHTVRRKLAHDLHYVQNVGPALDARIVVSTVLHFVGMAATAASRQLVARFAPSGAHGTNDSTQGTLHLAEPVGTGRSPASLTLGEDLSQAA
jgi:lipopolysaccharide/colanic/teichoic acid biosynthesis glycosyltransferase